MNEKRYISGIGGWAADKSLAKNIVNLLCRYAQNGEHQHIPLCFDTIKSIEEKEAFERLTSLENMALTDSLYLVRVVEPLLESLPSHNGSEPSFLYSLLQHIVRESTDAKEKEVKEQQRAIAEQNQIVKDLVKEVGISSLKTIEDIDAAIQKVKAVKAVLVKQPSLFIRDVQDQMSRTAKLPQLDETDKKVSAEQALELKRSYVAQLNKDLISSESIIVEANKRTKEAESNLTKQKAKNQKAREVCNNLSKLIGEIPASYGQQSPSNKKQKEGRFGFFNRKTTILVSKSNSKKDFLLKGKKGLCDNVICLLDQYIQSPGHSQDRVASAKKIYAEACKLKVSDNLSLLEKDRILLDLIRSEKIASKGRWNGKTSKLFAIYRAAEFYHREQLQVESEKVLRGELASRNETTEKMRELKSALQDLQSQAILMEDSILKLNQLREDELLLVMNAEKGTLTDEQRSANSRIQNNQSRKLEKLCANEKRFVQVQSDLAKKELEAVILSLDSEKAISDIKNLYNKTRDISIKLLSQAKVSLAILPESDTLRVSEMVSRATAYLTALKSSAEEDTILVFNDDNEAFSSCVATASF